MSTNEFNVDAALYDMIKSQESRPRAEAKASHNPFRLRDSGDDAQVAEEQPIVDGQSFLSPALVPYPLAA